MAAAAGQLRREPTSKALTDSILILQHCDYKRKESQKS